jgi:hypothetical protein
MKTLLAGWTAVTIVLGTVIPAARAGEWVVENASNQKWFDKMKPRYLAIHSEGRPCAAFGGDHLYYTERDAGGTWKVVTVDSSPGFGRYASLALHNGESPRIVYAGSGYGFGYAEGTLVHGEWQWSLEKIPGEGYYCSLALASNGQPHIAYYESPYGLHHIQRVPGGWSTPKILGTSSNPSRHYNIVVDQNGYPHIVAVTDSGTLNYHYQDGSGWHKLVISTTANAGVAPCLRITTNFLHLVFFEEDGAGFYNLLYRAFAIRTTAPYLIDEVVGYALDARDGSSLSMDILPTSQPQVAYTLAGKDYIFRAARSGTNQWLSYGLKAKQPSSIAIALVTPTQAIFSYRTQDQGISMASTSWSGNQWGPVTEFAHGSDASEHADIALLGDGSPVLAYHDGMGKGMVVLRRAGESGWFPYGGDPDPDAGTWVSLAAASAADEFHAACYVSDSGNLRYQRSDGNPVEGPTEVDSANDVGTHASLAVHPTSGNPAIAYRDETHQTLKFASRGTFGGFILWNPLVVDATVGTGAHASLVYGPDGEPHIAYRSDSSNELRVISRSASGWKPPETVMIDINPTDIAATVDAAGELHLSFISDTDDSLWHAWTNITGWSWESVGLSGVSGDTGIVIDGTGQPNILYRNWDSIEVARKRVGGGWDFDKVSKFAGASMGRKLTAAMIVGPTGRPMVCFYDPGHRDVMVAWLQWPQITSITESSPDHYLLQWTGDDHNIWIDRSPDLSPGSWTPAAGPIHGYSHVVSDTAARMFYRLRTE